MFPLDDLPRPLRPRIRRRSPRPNPNSNSSPRQDGSITSSADGSFGITSFGPSSSAFDSSSGFSSNSGAASSQGGTSTNGAVASLATTTIVSSTGFTSAASTPPSSSIVSITLSPSHSITAPPSSSSSLSSLTTPPISSSLSSGFVVSTFTSSFLSNINGSPTTIVTPIVTSLRTSPPPTSTPSRAAIITGSAIAGLVLLLIALTTIFIIRRRRRRQQRYWALSRNRLPSRATFLSGEDMDLPFPHPPFATTEHDDPFASRSTHHRPSSSVGSFHGGGTGTGPGPGPGPGPYAQSIYSRSQSSQAHALPPRVSTSSPRLLRVRASESGSIFQESVWPPPSAASQLIDPLTSPSQSVNLARIVTDVMGPHGSSTPEMGPLLPFAALSSRDHEHEHEHEHDHDHEHEQGQETQESGGERRSMITPPLSLSYMLTPPNMSSIDDWPRRSSSDSQLRPQSQLHQHQRQPSTPSPPETPPSRIRWLSRSPNPSPRTSHFPLQ